MPLATAAFVFPCCELSSYPAAWLLAMSSPSLSAQFAPRNAVELSLYGLAVTALAFTLTLWAIPA